MISVGYLNNDPSLVLCTNEGLKLESVFDKCNEEVESAYNHMMDSLENYMITEKVFKESGLGEDTISEEFTALEAEKENFLKKVGDMVIKTAKELIAFISGIIDKLKNISFKKKSDLQKLDMLCKEHPDLKDKIMKSFEDGSLSLPDVKSFKDLDASFEEILNMAKRKDIKPGSLQEKVENMKKKIDNVDKAKIVKVAGATATILGAITAAVKLSDMLKKNTETNSSKLEDTIQQMKDAGPEYYDESMSKIHILYNAHNWRLKKYRQAAGEADSVIERIMKKAMSFADNHTSASKKDAFHDNVRRAKSIKDERDRSELTKSVSDMLDKEVIKSDLINNNSKYDSMKDENKLRKDVIDGLEKDLLKKNQIDHNDRYKDLRRPKPQNNANKGNNKGGKGKGKGKR